MNKPTEQRLVDVLVAHLKKTGQPIECEVPIFSRRIDIVTITPAGEVWGIEAKVIDWQRCLSQAHVVSAAVQRVSIAIWDKSVHRVKWELLTNRGIGLIAVGVKWGAVEHLIEPELSRWTNPLVNERIKDYVTFGGYSTIWRNGRYQQGVERRCWFDRRQCGGTDHWSVPCMVGRATYSMAGGVERRCFMQRRVMPGGQLHPTTGGREDGKHYTGWHNECPEQTWDHKT